MSIQSVELAKCYRLLNHGPTVLVSSAYDDQVNVMAAAWSMPLDFDPPKVAVVIDRQTHTRNLIERSGEFVLNIPPKRLASSVLQAGTISGTHGSKLADCGFLSWRTPEVAVPLLDGCVGWLACRVLAEPQTQQRYDLFIGEVVAAYADSDVFSQGRWHFEGHDDKRTLHYVAGGSFLVCGERLEVAGGIEAT